MGLFSVRIGLSDGENQIENEMPLVAVAVIGDGNGRIVTEDRDSIGEWVEVNVNEMGADKSDC